ncbi:MAG TPA: TrkA C-terminal domain-containing protein [Nitrospira sp.]|nr:TrkA C-terminal domain-containing protein [Nitrospira sp.]
MAFELLDRVHKELSITGHAFYEGVLAISEVVNRKVEIIRRHWQASSLLRRIDDVTVRVGRLIAIQVSDRLHSRLQPDSIVYAVDEALTDARARIHELKRSLLQVDAQIRELKLEAIHQDLLLLHHDLSVRSAGIERVTVIRGAAAAGQPLSATPKPLASSIATVLRGPFLLGASSDLILQPGDIVIAIGPQADMDQLTHWCTGQRHLTPALTRSPQGVGTPI